MQVESIAKCSPRSILQYFWPAQWFYLAILWSYMQVIPNQKMAFISPISYIYANVNQIFSRM